jgi:hypothetical protein
MGFEPMPLARLAPKASALTTRPNLQPHANRVIGAQRLRWGPKKTKNGHTTKSLGGLEPPTPRSEV